MRKLIEKLMLGGNIFGHFTDETETRAIIDCARDLQIRAIDTANIYSEGLSEEFIGRAIQSDRDQWFIATKVGLRSHGDKRGLGNGVQIQKQIEESLRRLKTDYLDLYQIHHFDPETPLEETLKAFEDLKKKGMIRAAGISNYSLDQLAQLKEFPAQPFSYHQAPFNITHPQNTLLQPSASLGLSLIAYSVLARGLFNEKYLEGEIPNGSRAANSLNVRQDLSEEFLKKLRASSNLCIKHQCSLLEIALQWVCQFQAVRWAIVGVRSIPQLLSIQKALSIEMAPGILQEFEEIWHCCEKSAI